MKNWMFWIALIMSFLLGTCGDVSDIEEGAVSETAQDPWERVGDAELPTEAGAITDYVRALKFDDGMTVSYDGSSRNGEEKVCCRQERDNVIYHVCMFLENDPYFVSSESFSLVWLPLMFESFGTQLICKINEMEKDCEEVFIHMGGAGFRCEAGVFNGDRALLCSGQWAVVVNGDEDDTKTVCRVHIDTGTGRCLGAPKKGMANKELILEMQKSSWAGLHSAHANSRQVLAGESLSALTPRNLPVGAVLNYASSNESACTVDNDDSDGGIGTVTIKDSVTVPESCKIVLKITAKGFVDRVLSVKLWIVKNNDTTWADYAPLNGTFYVGESLSAGAVVSVDPVSPEIEYKSLSELVCIVDENGTITAVAAGLCTIRMTAIAEGYKDVVIDKVVNVLGLSELSTIEWSDFPAVVSVGIPTSALDVPIARGITGHTVVDSNLTFRYENTSGGCSFDSTTNILYFFEESECVITVTAIGMRGYQEQNMSFRVSPGKGDLGLTWTGYRDMNPKLTDTSPALVAPVTASPSDGNGVNYSYTVGTGTVCDVDADTGILTLKKTGVCMVSVTASRSSYNNDVVMVTVNIAKGEQNVMATEPYGGAHFLGASDNLSLENAPQGGQGNLVYRKKNASDDCTVTGQGEVTAGSSGAGTCTIQAMWTVGPHHEASDWSDIATITMVANGQTFTWGDTPYGPGLSVKVDEDLILVNAPTGGTGGAEYKTAHSQICRVAANGTITGLMVGTCSVQGRWQGDSTAGVSDWVEIPIIVEKGDGPTDLRGSHIYGAYPSLKVGETLDVVEMPLAYGRQVVYRIKSGSENFCEVDQAVGTVTGLTVGSCNVEGLLLGTDNYTPSTADLLTIGVQPGVQFLNIGSAPYGTTSMLAARDSLAIVNLPTGSRGGDIYYRVKIGSVSYCSVDSDGTVVGDAPGDCTIQARAAAVDNYSASAWTDIAIMVIGKGILADVSWNPAQDRAVVGDELILSVVNGGSAAPAITYIIANKGGTGCAFKGSSGNDARTLIFQDVGICVVTAIATHANYNDWEGIKHPIRVEPGNIDFTVGTFATGATLKVGAVAPQTPSSSGGLNPVDAVVSWQLARGERDCILLNHQTGAVRAKAVPIVEGSTLCSLIALADKRGYRTAKKGPVDIPLEKGDLGTITPPDYGFYNELAVGEMAILERAPQEINNTELLASYDARGTTAGGTSKENVCRVDVDGTVYALSSGQVGDKCIVSTMITAVGYNDPGFGAVADVTLVLKEGLLFDYHPTPAWGGTLTVGVSTPISLISHLPGSDDSTPSIPVIWGYRVSEWGRDGHTPKTSGHICTVDNSGQITLGSNPSPGDICRVYVIASATGNHVHYTRVPAVDLIVHGVLGTIAPQVYGRSGFPVTHMLVGRSVEVMTPPSESNHIPIEASYVAVGMREGSETINICSVDNHPDSSGFGTVSIDPSARKGDICEITATVSAIHYHNKDANPVRLAVVEQLRFVPTPILAYSENLKYGSSVGLTPIYTLPQNDDNGVAVRWEYQMIAGASGETGDFKSDVCLVDATSGVLSLDSAALPGDACLIEAIATADGYADYTISLPVEVRPGDLLFATATVPSYSGSLRVSGTIAPTLPGSSVDDNGIAVTWGSWHVVEHDRDGGDDGLDDGDICSIDNVGVVSAKGGGASASDTCTVYVTATADHYGHHERVVATFTLMEQGTFTDLTAPVYTDDLLPGGSVVAMDTAPTATPLVGTTWTYAAVGTREGVSTDDICSVGSDGTVAPEGAAMVGDVCTVIATAHHNGYDPAPVPPVVLTLKGRFDSLAWAMFPSTGTVGVDVNLSGNQPQSFPIADSYAIDVISGDCAYDEGTHVLSFTNTAQCFVRVTAFKNHYDDKEETFAITPGVGALVFATPPTIGYGGFLRYGDLTTELSPVTLPTADDNGVGVIWNYDVEGRASDGTTLKANVCELASNNKIVLLVGAGVGDICNIGVSGSAVGYDDYTSVTELQMSVEEGIIVGLAWNPPATGSVGIDLVLPVVAGTETTDTVTYSKVSGSCSLNASTRSLAFSGTGDCIVKATVARSGYGIWDSGDKTIRISSGTLLLATTPTLTYTGSLQYGDASTMLVPTGLPSDDDNLVSITWHYTLQGRNSEDNADKDNVCVRANADSSHADYDKIQLGSAAAVGDICRVGAIGRVAGYSDYGGVASVDLTVALGTQPAPAGWSNHYGASPSVAVENSLPAIGISPTNLRPDGGALEYHIKSGSCTLDTASGEITGGGTGSCVVEARFAAVAEKYAASDYSDVATITIAMGSQSYADWSQGDAGVTFGSELPLAQFMEPPVDATIIYLIDSDTNTAGCAWKGASGADERTLTFGDDGSCQVRLQVSRIGYGDWISDAITVTVTPLSWISANWSGYDSSSATYGNAAPGVNPPTSVPEADSWTYSTGSTSCTVESDDGSLTIVSVGSCTVTAIPSKAGYVVHTGVENSVTIDKGNQGATPAIWGDLPYGSVTPMVRVDQTLPLGDTVPPVNPLADGGALEYHMKSGAEHCRLGLDGTVTGLNVGSCTIEVRFAGTANYNPSLYADVATITVALGQANYTWSQSATTVTFGANGNELAMAALSPLPHTPATTTYQVNGANTAGCTWKGSGGVDARTLTFADAGTCNVQVGVTRSNYEDWNSDAVTITVDPAAWIAEPRWDGFDRPIVFGGRHSWLPASSDPSATWTWSIDPTDSSICTRGDLGRLTVLSVGTCRVTMTATLAGHPTRSITETLTIRKADQSAPSAWSNPYGSSPVVTIGGDPLPIDSDSTPPTGHGVLEYQVKSGFETYCRVTSATGAVTGLAAGLGEMCEIQAHFAGNGNYNPSAYVDIATVAVYGGQTLATPTYTEGNHLYVGIGNQVWLDPTVFFNPIVHGSINTVVSGYTFSYMVTGRRGVSTTAGICTVVGTVGLRKGIVQVGNAAQVGDTCEVTVTSNAPNYTPVSASVTLTVRAAITYTELASRILTDNCMSCHGSGSANGDLSSSAAMNTEGVLNIDPTQADIWKRVKKTNAWSDSTYSSVSAMPPSSICSLSRQSGCLTSVEVEYLASFLRGGTWQP